MVFSIGWSGVSVASVKTMQLSMQMQHQKQSEYTSGSTDHQQMMQQSVAHQAMQNMSVQEMKNHCTEMLQHDQTVDLKQQNLKNCHSQLVQAKQVQHSDCQECTLFSCQSSIVWFNTDVPKFTPLDFSEKQSALQVWYQAEHLAGHWQEILRPPKA